MENIKLIRLENGVIIDIRDESLTCTDVDDTTIFLTVGQQKLLKKLADNLNRTVPFDRLYASYATAQQMVCIGNENSNIAKMKRTFPDCIRSSIKNTRDLGYRLEGTFISSASDILPKVTPSPLAELTGDYYGFYLDPLGNGTLLSAYLHIDNIGSADTPELMAYMISGIRNQQVLCDDNLAKIFTLDTFNYEKYFREYKEMLSENDQRCSWGEGTLSYKDNLALLTLTLNHGNWEVFIDMENYLKGNRKKENENDYYRGGLGLVLATRTIHGTYCLRMGLVRKSFFKDSLLTDKEKMAEMFKIMDGSRDAEWKPLKLSGWLDKRWYDLIMDE